MSDRRRSPSWLERPSPRQAALDLIKRYWGLEAMQRQRALIGVPLLPLGEGGDAEDDRG